MDIKELIQTAHGVLLHLMSYRAIYVSPKGHTIPEADKEQVSEALALIAGFYQYALRLLQQNDSDVESKPELQVKAILQVIEQEWHYLNSVLHGVGSREGACFNDADAIAFQPHSAKAIIEALRKSQPRPLNLAEIRGLARRNNAPASLTTSTLASCPPLSEAEFQVLYHAVQRYVAKHSEFWRCVKQFCYHLLSATQAKYHQEEDNWFSKRQKVGNLLSQLGAFRPNESYADQMARLQLTGGDKLSRRCQEALPERMASSKRS